MYGLEQYPDCPVDYEKLSASIKVHEGIRFLPYTDTTGHISIGVGRNLSTQGISADECELMFSNDIRSAIGTAQAQSWWPYVRDNDARARAFVEIGFNIGFKALSGFHQALDAARRGDWDACSANFLDSLWHRQVGRRAEEIAAMIASGEDQPAPPLQS